MNLNNNPTAQQLSQLLSVCNDDAGHHILWVSKTGDVSVTLINDIGPIGFEQNTPSMAMRYETFQRGNKYVGQEAANDESYVNRLLKDLINEWPLYSGKSVRYIG
ncbi:hypothetical protein E1L19_08660 [Salmonella enterica subsp. enterica]|uniref:Uncharacterized protein n=1 Tax=Salmonella enterica TaxID=28901 RepID=A0A5T2XKL2_SALER|nr:hypothetical protein [Salmonella enterica]ECI7826055.1 hypothetical protein [Salmonella enterica subsp. enterica]EEF0001406.1 hypothetical protein [Salmonella enterica subsp. enterica serovar Braenderup]EHQ6136060.1 hypothetical protein [Salmonella enterica subsp. enterica serovar Wien]HAU2608346.1 hypothetical protein [Salmonella enterica subsp. enterica serovar Tennessee]